MGFGGGIMNFGASLGLAPGAEKVYGTKPTVPQLGAEQQKAIAANQAALPGLETLATDVNQFSQQQKNAMLSFIDPNWQKNFGLAGEQINKMMLGELPTSDVAMSQLHSVSSALSGGFGGTPAMGNLVARDLGIEQQQVINQGLAANDRWLRTAESLSAPTFDMTRSFISPEQQFQRDWQQSLIAAAPDPVARGQSDAWNALIGEVLSMYGGGAGFKGGYTPQWPGGGGGGGGGGGDGSMMMPDYNSGSTFNFDFGGSTLGYGGGGNSYTDIPATPGY